MRNLDHGAPGNATGLGFGLAPSLSGLLCKWADVSRAAGKTEQARQAAKEALALAKASHDTLHTTMAMFWLGYLADERGDHAEWEREITSAVTLLETFPPGEELLWAYWAMADVHALAGRPADAVALCSRVLDLAPAGSMWKSYALTVRGMARAMLSDPAFLEDDHEAIRLARQHALDAYLLPDTLNNIAHEFWLAQGPEAALGAHREAHEIVQRKGIALLAMWTEADSFRPTFDLGRWDELLEHSATVPSSARRANSHRSARRLAPDRAADGDDRTIRSDRDCG
jgi:tetratricopeptide (TPR) repeat protein